MHRVVIGKCQVLAARLQAFKKYKAAFPNQPNVTDSKIFAKIFFGFLDTLIPGGVFKTRMVDVP
jgi:hypothetical protein